MAQLFPPESDIILRKVLVSAIAVLVILPFAVWAFARSPAATGQYRTLAQPVPFPHALHVNGFHIDCRYCHAEAERSAMAGLPPTDACVSCHKDVVFQSSAFAAVRESLSTGRPIPWRRVNSVPDFVYFNHAVHVRNGVTCDSCHGPVGAMDTVYQAAPMTMEWCLQCHRNPERYISLKETRLAGWWHGDAQRGAATMKQYDIERLTSCTTCHR
jgi:hypothetical protein